MAFLFEEIRYEISGITIDSIKKVGITSTIKGLLSISPNEINVLQTAGWVIPQKVTIVPDKQGYFDFCVPLRMLLGFAEDYQRIIMNVKQELVLLRSSTNYDIIAASTGVTESTLDWKLTLSKVVWRVPHVRLADQHRITLLKQLNSDRDIVLPFRSWEMHEYPNMPATQRHLWAIKTSNQLERPRYVIFALQTDKRNNVVENAGTFNSCKLVNAKLFLNSQFFPYDNINISFAKERYSILYDMYARFQKSYYNKNNTPLLTPENFKTIAPIVVIDCSKQNESIKASAVDIRLEIEFEDNIPENTIGYCLIIHDTIVTYTPLTGMVKRVA